MTFWLPSPLEQFEINNVCIVNFLGYEFTLLNNIGLYFILITMIILGLNLLSLNNNKIVPTKWSISQETFYATVYNMVINQIGKTKGQKYFPFIYTLFIFILISNFMGNIPYSFAVTSHLIFTISLSLTIFLGVTIIAITHHGLKFFSLMCPSGTPLALVPLLVLIETVSYIARAVSLGLRLGANIMAGHMLLVILASFLSDIFSSALFILGVIPFIIFIGIGGLELAISAIQSYVFVILTCSYIKDSIDLH